MLPTHRHVLVTGSNSGLGLGICTRLIDDFALTQPLDGRLTIIFTTRSERKSAETLATLSAHLAKHNSKAHLPKIDFRPEIVELTSLLSVQALARKLLASDLPCLDAIILNAGIGGWTGMNWPVTLWATMTEIRQSTTWPTSKLGAVGLVTKPQLAKLGTATGLKEPPLGEIFCANVFGHYLLVHWLMPLLWACPSSSPARIIWVGSVEAGARHYQANDHQGLLTDAAYEHSKRIIEFLAVTSRNEPATAELVQSFLSPSLKVDNQHPRPSSARPEMYVMQPGICTTTIIALYWIMQVGYALGVYLARWCGSPWATATPYIAAKAATWLAIAPKDEIRSRESQDGGGAAKWGTAVDRLGNPRIERTDVEGWGINGSGEPFEDKWWGGNVGRRTGHTDATKEDVQKFVADGAEIWRKMEELRLEWEGLIEVCEAS